MSNKYNNIKNKSKNNINKYFNIKKFYIKYSIFKYIKLYKMTESNSNVIIKVNTIEEIINVGEYAKVNDVNDNTISLMKYTYDTHLQGSIVEKCHFLKDTILEGGVGELFQCDYVIRKHFICILRNYPVVMTKATSYSLGTSTTTEYLSLDQITGEPLVTKTTDMNGGITLSRKLPAFRVASYTAMSPKAIRSTYKNIVSADFSSKLLKDTVFSSNGDFASYNINTYKRNFKQRKLVV